MHRPNAFTPHAPPVEERTSDESLILLRALSRQFPNIDAAMAEIARLSAVLTLPKGTIHIISDIHGEDKKLRHVINNASGTLRPVMERVFGKTLDPQVFQELRTLIFYPGEVVEVLADRLKDPQTLRAYAIRTMHHQLMLVRELASRYSLKRAMDFFPPEYRELFGELLHEPTTERGDAFYEAIVDELIRRGRVLHLIHIIARLVRNLAISELIIGGDCWDRGPRGDRVVDYLRQQPNVSFIWGNHDISWLGAGLGNEALICNVIRISLRYRRLTQLDEGYSIPLTPLEHLANTVYANDPATHFFPKSGGLRPDILVARMQKAVAIMQFKLEGQMIARNSLWEIAHRRLLHGIDHAAGTIAMDGRTFALRDREFPTIDPADPYALSAEEKQCMCRLRHSFLSSQKLAEHLRYIVESGSMYLVRDDHLIFHGCIPCDDKGDFLSMKIDGRDCAGRDMLEAIETVVRRALEDRREPDLDFLWYLWSGPLSPLFGKDRITTLERDFIADKLAHHETKDPYFSLIHEKWFCQRVLEEFSVDPDRGLIVNGHVPVKIEKGEDPLKRSGMAITIDGAFSEAYGDHGYTLVLEANHTLLAKHHHFESVESAIRDGVDIIPTVTIIRTWDRPRKISDTERGRELNCQVAMLEKLIQAYEKNRLRQTRPKATSW
jgi:fructose-1,6-bisphosphatase III